MFLSLTRKRSQTAIKCSEKVVRSQLSLMETVEGANQTDVDGKPS